MSRRCVYSKEVKIKACKDYLSGRKTMTQISKEIAPGKRIENAIHQWIEKYKAKGPKAFDNRPTNGSYTKEFKEKVVKERLEGKGSMRSLAIKYDIPSISTIAEWIRKYNSHIELKNYVPKGEVYMAERKKTTYEERIEIVKWCLEHDRSIKDTAAHFGLSYYQVRNYVIKYEELGEEGLIDKRGKRKADEELTELELAQRENKRLQKKVEELEMRNELLKKVMERERW